MKWYKFGMKLLTKESDYAIRAIVSAARRGDGYVSSRRIAEEESIPLQFLRRILVALVKAGVVQSKEGVNGGIRLIKDPQSIRLADIIRIFQGDIRLTECLFRRKLCSNRNTCVLRRRIARIEQLVTSEFERITIADLIKDMEGAK